jgi:HNH endonuclease
MTHGPTRITSKGACIYCGATGVKLTDEHVLPLSLGGGHVIADASCLACADITKRFEQDVARELWGDARTSYDAPSRRKKQGKTHIILTDPENPARTVKVPYHDYPAPMVFYRMGRAGLLEGMPDTLDISGSWKLEAMSDHEKNKEFERKYGIKLTARFRHVPESFARLLAKIGYGQILTSPDPGDFRPICVPYILGHRKNPSYIVGGKLISDQPDPGIGYVMKTAGFGMPDRLMLMAELRLYANNHVPTYHVVVGDVVGTDKVAAALKKIGVIDLQVLSPMHVPGAEPDHWMPTCWPLPFWQSGAP